MKTLTMTVPDWGELVILAVCAKCDRVELNENLILDYATPNYETIRAELRDHWDWTFDGGVAICPECQPTEGDE